MEEELDTCPTTEAMLNTLDKYIAARWDGKSEPTSDQYRGGRILGSRGEWLDIMDVMRGRRRLCMIVRGRDPEISGDHGDDEFFREIKKEGLFFVTYQEPKEDNVVVYRHQNLWVNTDIVVCSSPQVTIRAQLILELMAKMKEFTRQLNERKKPDTWLDVNMETVRTGLLLGYTMADTMFFLHRIMCKGGCLPATSTECKHLNPGHTV